jgi:uncharacterized membrane protein YeaQ/YmgE (transglycosylase-associated protein family)
MDLLWVLIVGGLIGWLSGNLIGRDVPGGVPGNVIAGFIGSWLGTELLRIKVQNKHKRTESIHRWKMNTYGPFFVLTLSILSSLKRHGRSNTQLLQKYCILL